MRQYLLVWLMSGLAVAAAADQPVGLKVDADKKEIRLDATISTELDRYRDELKGAIEYLACSEGGKEYESLLVLKAEPQAIFDALKQIGASPGKFAHEDAEGKLVPPKGDPLRLWVQWKRGEKVTKVRAESLVLSRERRASLKPMDWIFTGSRMTWPLDEESDEQVLEATLMKNIIGLHYADRSVLLQNPLPEANLDNLYEANRKQMPAPGTSVTLVIQNPPRKAPPMSAR